MVLNHETETDGVIKCAKLADCNFGVVRELTVRRTLCFSCIIPCKSMLWSYMSLSLISLFMMAAVIFGRIRQRRSQIFFVGENQEPMNITIQ